MDIQSDSSLSDILSRAKRLEHSLPFLTYHTVPSILQISRNISRASDDYRVGYLLLAQQHVNIEEAKEFLNGITTPRIVSDNYISFKDRSDFSYHDVIIKSIRKVQKKTEKLNADLILRSFQRKQLESKSFFDQSKIDRTVSVPTHNIDSATLRTYNDLKMELIKKAKFYCDLLPEFKRNMAKSISQKFYLRPNNIYDDQSQYYGDTFNLIDILKKADNIIKGSSAFLESQEKWMVRKKTNENLMYLERGGEIGIIPTIKAYLELEKDKYSESPWAIIYYAIRCGERIAVSDFAEIADVESHVKEALQAYSNDIPITGNLKNSLVSYLNSEFQSERADPYKVRALSVLTKDRRAINSEYLGKMKIQDWIWYELQFANDTSDFVEKLSESHQFDQPDLQGQILLMIGSYDKAAHWFLNQTQNYIDNLHVVLCLHVSGLISSDILLEKLIDYSIDVFKSDQESAVRYLTLIREEDKRIESLVDLIIKSDRGYEVFEHSISNILLPNEEKLVLKKASQEARSRDNYDLAINLYILNNDYQSILSYDCVRLRDFIKNSPDSDSINTIIQHYAKIEEEDTVDVHSLKTMFLLIKLANAVNFLDMNKYENAIVEFESCDIFPPKGFSSENCSLLLSAENKHIVPFVIIRALEAYYHKYLAIGNNYNSNSDRQEIKKKTEEIREFSSRMSFDSETHRKILNLCTLIK